MKLDTLNDLYVSELRDIYNAEKQLTKALPKMAKAASDAKLRSALEEHLEVTKSQVDRLERLFDELGLKPTGEKCEGMEGLVSEGEELIKEKGDDAVRDAGIIVAAQKVEHYEISGYGSLAALAKRLGRRDDASVLHEIMEEEKEADQKLSDIAEGFINQEAARA